VCEEVKEKPRPITGAFNSPGHRGYSARTAVQLNSKIFSKKYDLFSQIPIDIIYDIIFNVIKR
jgi:hypothetical protein